METVKITLEKKDIENLVRVLGNALGSQEEGEAEVPLFSSPKRRRNLKDGRNRRNAAYMQKLTGFRVKKTLEQ